MAKTNLIDKKKSKGRELVRFIICGIAATIIDYLICQLVVLICQNGINQYAIIAISTFFGFVGGTVVNYFISTFWVYQNVDKDVKSKSPKFILIFVILSLISTALSIGVMMLSNLITTSIWGEAGNIVNVSIIDLIKKYGIAFLTQQSFWIYFVSFCIRVVISLAFNYVTRKVFLYKPPKEETSK